MREEEEKEEEERTGLGKVHEVSKVSEFFGGFYQLYGRDEYPKLPISKDFRPNDLKRDRQVLTILRGRRGEEDK